VEEVWGAVQDCKQSETLFIKFLKMLLEIGCINYTRSLILYAMTMTLADEGTSLRIEMFMFPLIATKILILERK